VSGPVPGDARDRDTARVPVVDVARGLAILCMLVAHGVPFLWPTGLSAPLQVVLQAVNDVASPLFGLAMGAAAALVWSRPGVRRHWPRRVGVDVGRGVVVFALGILAAGLDTWVAVVLHVLGVLIVIGVPVAALGGADLGGRGRTVTALGAVTVALFALAPWVTALAAPVEDRVLNGTAGGPAEVWVALVAGYSYRAVSLLPFFALGGLLVASGLASRPRRLATVSVPVVGVLLVAEALVRRRWTSELSGDPVDQLADLTLVAVAVLVAAAIVGLMRGPGVQRPLADLGAVALSVYVLQLLVLRPLMSWPAWVDSAALGWFSLAVLVIVPSALMIAWRRRLGPGPLERVVALVTGNRRAT
jgi:uncharacterized protein